MTFRSISFSIAAFLIALAVAAAPAFADKSDKKRAKIMSMRDKTLTELFESRPQAKAEIDDAVGYAVFSNVGVNVIFLSAGGGSGVAHDNRSGQNTYMKMATAGVGIGLGIKDFRAVFVFHTEEGFDSFVDKGWDFSGQADAAATVDDVGGEVGEAASIRKKVSVYQFTKNGLALQATLQGTKYWKNKKLNK